METKNDPKSLINEKRAAEFLGLSVKTLQKRRVSGDSPPFVKISSRCVRYRVADLVAWTEDRLKTSTSQA